MFKFKLQTKASLYKAQEKVNSPPLDSTGQGCISSNYHNTWNGVEALLTFIKY